MKITVTKENKIFLYFLILIICPVAYNKLGYKFAWNNLEILSIGFLLLNFIMFVYLFASVVMICAMRHVFSGVLDSPASYRKYLLGKIGYYSSSIVPSLIVFLVFLSIWIWNRDEFWDMLWMNSIWRISLIALMLSILTYLIEKNKSWALFDFGTQRVEVVKEVIKEVERIVEIPVLLNEVSGLPKKIALNEMYTYLVHEAGVGPIISGKMIRFFDIVAVKTTSGVRHIIFSDGTVERCDHILSMLEELNIKSWMIKISDGYMINMLLVNFPNFKKGRQLQLHTETMQGLLRNMLLADILLMLTMGVSIKDRYIQEFLKSKNSLTHVGWDTWVPYKK